MEVISMDKQQFLDEYKAVFKENGKEDMNDKIKRLIKMGCEG